MSRSDDTFREPRITLHRIYTRSGDSGTTLLVNGRRVAKDDPRVEAYGTIDELNALIGRARECLRRDEGQATALRSLGAALQRVQHELFNLGSEVATDPDAVGPAQPRIRSDDVTVLEAEIDEVNAKLPVLPSFVLPGGSPLAAELHVCRTVCRRAERRLLAVARSSEGLGVALRYMNRLSDALFVWSRWACVGTGHDEVLWNANFRS